MLTIASFIVVILIPVSLRELGHSLVVRWYGVKVVCFSIGSGKPSFTKKRGDTEQCLAPIPLDGYVKMVDTREGNIVETDLPFVFDRQYPAKRIVVVAAGPLTNLILAIILYGLSLSFGVTEIRPYVSTVEPASTAATAGFVPEDKILSVSGKAVKNWSDVQTEILLEVKSRRVDVAVQTASGQQTVRAIDAAGTLEVGKVTKNSGNIGLRPFKMTIRLGLVMKNDPMERAGLKVGGRLLTADGKPIEWWLDWVDLFRRNSSNRVTIGYECGGKIYEVNVRPDTEESSDGTLVGKVGTAPQHGRTWDKWVRYQYTPSVPEAFRMGWDKMTSYSLMIVEFFGKFMTGKASLSHVSGLLTIAGMAGRSAALGIQSYLELLALVSVSLGVMNLLPMPVLDGGHLMYYTAKRIRGRPLSERIQVVGPRFGLAAVLMLMLAAFFNDINRLFG